MYDLSYRVIFDAGEICIMLSHTHSIDFDPTIERLRELSSARKGEAAQETQQGLSIQKSDETSERGLILGAITNARARKESSENGNVTLKVWESLPKELTENQGFIKVILTDKHIILSKALQKQILKLYWKDHEKFLQENTKATEDLVFSSLSKSPSKSSTREISLLQSDPVLMNALSVIKGHLGYIELELAQEKDRRKFAESMQGMKQAIGTLYEIGELCRSESLQKTALVLNHGLDLAVSLSHLTGKALPTGFVSMGAAMGQIGMVVSAVAGIFAAFKKKKKEDNAFAQIILSYLQTISHQIYNLHSDMLRGFEMVTDNQKKMMEFMIKSVEHLDLLVRAEAQAIRNSMTDLGQHLDLRLDKVMQLTVKSGQEVHLQNFYQLLKKVDKYCKNKKSITPEKVKELNDDLSFWIEGDSHFSANPLHTGAIQLMTQQDDLMHYINSEFKNIEKQPEKALHNMAFLAQIAEKAFKIPMVQDGKTIDTTSIPNPMIWLHGSEKFSQLRKEFADVLGDDKDTISSSMGVADNLFNFIKFLQTNPAIYIKLFEAYEAELANIITIAKMATQETNRQINEKLLEVKDQKSLKEDKFIFDVSKNLKRSFEKLDELFDEEIVGNLLHVSFPYYLENSKGTGVKSTFSKKKLTYRDCKDNLTNEYQTVIKKALLLKKLGLMESKSHFDITTSKMGGEKMGYFNFNIAFFQNNAPINLFKVIYHLNGDTSSWIPVRSGIGWWYNHPEFNGHYVKLTGFDSDLASNSIQIYETNCNSIQIKEADGFVQPFLSKRQFANTELEVDYKKNADQIQKLLDDCILTFRKNIISILHNASIGHGKEPYQSALKSSYEKLDGYKRLLTCFASIAGMSEVDSKHEGAQLLRIPKALADLPDSKSIIGQLDEYPKKATIDTPWPIDHLQDSVPAAKKLILDSVAQEAHRSVKQDKPPKDTLKSLIQFVSFLQIELSMHFYQLLEHLISTQEQPTKKLLSEQDEKYIAQQYKKCLVHFTLQKEWIKRVEKSWICFDALEENISEIQKLLRINCSNINEMGRNLPEIVSRIIEIHNLLATYFAEKGYTLNIDFTKYILEQMKVLSKKLEKLIPISADRSEDLRPTSPAEVSTERDLDLISRTKTSLGILPAYLSGSTVGHLVKDHKVTINGRAQIFAEYEVKGDGDCGFTALGVERKEAVRLLKQIAATSTEKRNAIINELLQGMENFKTASRGEEVDPTGPMPPDVRNKVNGLFEELTIRRNQCSIQCDKVRKLLDKNNIKLSADGNTDEAVLAAISTNTLSIPLEPALKGEFLRSHQVRDAKLEEIQGDKEIFNAYVESYNGHLWLGEQSMRCIAEAKGRGLIIWGINPSTIELQMRPPAIPAREGETTIHVLLKPGHYNFLVEDSIGEKRALKAGHTLSTLSAAQPMTFFAKSTSFASGLPKEKEQCDSSLTKPKPHLQKTSQKIKTKQIGS